MSEPATPLLALHHINKAFGPVTVLEDVSLTVNPGKVSVLLGENGAGKSTLIKIMSGIYQPDSGEILAQGIRVKLPNVRAAEAHRIATIHQELNLVPSLSVAQNVSLGREPRRWGAVNKKELNRIARKAMKQIGLDLEPTTPVSQLGIAHQQLVEIAKALSQDAQVLILDEPTAALTRSETQALFNVMRELRQRGVGLVFISHHLEEIAEIGDTISVLRDGKFIAEVPADTPEKELITLMVGREINQESTRPQKESAGRAGNILETPPPLLSVRHLNTPLVKDISLDLYPGEVAGLAGLVGAGRTELLRAIAGADAYTSGEVRVRGKQLKRHDVQDAIRHGLGHVPEDRKQQGLVLDASVGTNIGYATLAKTARAGLVNAGEQRKLATDVAQALRIKMHSIDQPIRLLSGGNQQKAVFARWITAGSDILLLDEPTRGVDVGAKAEIYELINQVSARGGAVLVVSSELPEVLRISDRILVMASGALTGELEREKATQDAIMELAVQT